MVVTHVAFAIEKAVSVGTRAAHVIVTSAELETGQLGNTHWKLLRRAGVAMTAAVSSGVK